MARRTADKCPLWREYDGDESKVVARLEQMTTRQASEAFTVSISTVEHWHKILNCKPSKLCVRCGAVRRPENMVIYGNNLAACPGCHVEEEDKPKKASVTHPKDYEMRLFAHLIEDVKLRLFGDSEWNGYKGQLGRISYE